MPKSNGEVYFWIIREVYLEHNAREPTSWDLQYTGVLALNKTHVYIFHIYYSICIYGGVKKPPDQEPGHHHMKGVCLPAPSKFTFCFIFQHFCNFLAKGTPRLQRMSSTAPAPLQHVFHGSPPRASAISLGGPLRLEPMSSTACLDS